MPEIVILDFSALVSQVIEEAKMRRKLYFVLPDVKSAHDMMHELLLARVEASCIHFHANPAVVLDDLPQANVLEKTDVVNCSEIGLLLGAGLGVLAGTLAVVFSSIDRFSTLFGHVSLMAIPICAVIGAVSSALWSGLLATTIPHNRITMFEKQLEQGQILLMVSVRFHRVREVRELLLNRHPEAAYGGMWPAADHVLFP